MSHRDHPIAFVLLAASARLDARQHVRQLPTIRSAFSHRALRQVVQLAPHTGQIGRMGKTDQPEIRLLILDRLQKGVSADVKLTHSAEVKV
ncbi:hypothetical protein, partial [Xanthomonas citri]|uniref:hypothetical protein n=1 Tax=Xanthomonas citri TaxID=346 RepID=UPI001C2BCD00